MFGSLQNFLEILPYGKKAALPAEQLYSNYLVNLSVYIKPIPLVTFKRLLRTYSHSARLAGHWVIGDDSGYYLALSKAEWEQYRNRRLAALKDELTALANCDRISVADFIKLVYHINVNNPNYEMSFK